MPGIDNMSRLNNILAVAGTREVFDWEQPNLSIKTIQNYKL